MKYALATILDQTHGYWTPDGWTTKHPEATLFSFKVDAEALIVPTMERENVDSLRPNTIDSYWIEDVPDEAEFRAREDTW